MLDLIKKILPRVGSEQRCCCFHFGRCGSTVLGNMLNAHSAINWQSEIFHEYHERDAESKDSSEPLQILHDVIKRNSLSVLGIEIKFQHLDANGLDLTFADFLEVLAELGFAKFIVLKRSNFLRQAISVARGQQSKTWHVKKHDAKPDFSKVALDLEQVGLGGKNRELLECFESLDNSYRESMTAIENAGFDLLPIQYELDLETDPFVGYEKVIQFLDLGLQKPEVSLQKLGGQTIPEMVADYDSIVSRLSGSRYEWMLEN